MLIAWICGLIQGLVIYAYFNLDGGEDFEDDSFGGPISDE